MIREFFTDIRIIVCMVILTIISIGCILYYRSVESQIRLQESITQKYLDNLLIDNTEDDNITDLTNTRPSPMNDTGVNNKESAVKTGSSLKGNKSSYKSKSRTILSDELTASKPLEISPHGFGVYPDIPEGAPVAEFRLTDSVNRELMKRVLVKAWNEGERFTGGTFDSSRGKVYLNYSNVVYVQYSNYIDEDTGEIINHISETMAGFYMDEIFYESLKLGNVPSGYEIVNFDDAGINPYGYLDLN